MTRIIPSVSADDLAGGATEPPTEDARRRVREAELERFQGIWHFVSIEDDGSRASGDDLTGITVVIEGDRFTLRNGATINRGVLTVDPAATPKAIDVVFSKGPQRGKTMRGIYELDGDLLKFCNASLGEGRPTRFASKPGGGLTLQVLRRAKPQISQPKG